jgi:hypothetical protein
MVSPKARRIPIKPWMFVPLTIVAMAVAGLIWGRGLVLLTLGAFVLGAVIWTFWESVRSLTGDAQLTIDEALGLGAPSAEEERKRAVLRSLKDLEYERGVGKVSEADYRELSSKYREEAKALLQLLDQTLGPARLRAEQLLEERIKAAGLTTAERQEHQRASLDSETSAKKNEGST